MDLLFDYFDKGGVIFLVLGFLSLLSITIIVYKFLDIFYFNELNIPQLQKPKYELNNFQDFETMFNKQSDNDKIKLNEIKYFLEEIYKSSKKEDEIYFYLNEKFKNIQFFMPSLEIISQVSPLIGLLGTVIGMIDSFNELELGGSLVDPSILAGGIWTALLTTAMGLLVAIPALVAHYFFEKKINKLYEFYYFFFLKISYKK